MDTDIQLYRKRFIPNELIYLKDDILLEKQPDSFLTSWSCLKPRPDISRGLSIYYFDDGFKISKIYNSENQLVYWYCDIIRLNRDRSKYIFEDLLVDVIIYPNGKISVLDLDEIAYALKEDVIDSETTCEALYKLDHLLKMLDSSIGFASLKQPIEHWEHLHTL